MVNTYHTNLEGKTMAARKKNPVASAQSDVNALTKQLASAKKAADKLKAKLKKAKETLKARNHGKSL